MKKFLFLLCVSAVFLACDFSKYKMVKEYDFTTVFEKSGGTETATYEEIIKYYQDLSEAYPSVHIEQIGTTDSGKPLHLVIYNPEANFDFEKLGEEKNVILINNGIHPGESDGIDASMLLMRNLAMDSIATPENTVLAVIPVYNVGGALNRNSTTRTNQNGPKEYGFRGNARNYDLNRDFIKADTRNTMTFYKIFHLLKPDVFIDTHVSNGADYQYTLTHLFTQQDKLGGSLGKYLEEKMIPSIENKLAEKDWPVTPYVNVFNEVPEEGFEQFMDFPRYSTGYASLWNTLALMIETHMLKPYAQRVEGTYEFLLSILDYVEENASEIKEYRTKAFEEFSEMEKYPIAYEVDASQPDSLTFRGYEPEMVKSEVTGKYRLKYNRKKPFVKKIEYFNTYNPTDFVSIPEAYVIPRAWQGVIHRLKLNNIQMEVLEQDTLMPAEVYRIESYKTVDAPFEGHYLHYDTEVSAKTEEILLKEGDFYVPTNQPGIKYILETLEPEAVDSFFNWNFFDTVLQQKEHFSPYVFEDVAAEILKKNPELKKEFLEKKKEDFYFANSAQEQLNWIYQQTPHYESAHMRYPVFRIR